METIKYINIDFSKKVYDNIIAKANDVKSRFIQFRMLDNQRVIDLTGITPRVYFLKPDGKEGFNDLVVNDPKSGLAILELTEQMLAVAGVLKMELNLIKDGARLSNIQFEVEVISSLTNAFSIISTNEWGSLVSGLDRLDTWDKQFEDKYNNLENQYATNLANKVDKVTGKGLSTNDFTNAYKNKVDGLNNYTHPSSHGASIITQDANNRFVTDAEKEKWNYKSNSAVVHIIKPSGSNYGDCFVVKDYDGTVSMVDCSDDPFSYIKGYLDSVGITRVDRLFITHSHSDHISTAPEIIRYYRPKEIYYRTPNWSSMPTIETTWQTKQYHDAMIQAATEVGCTKVELTSDRIIPFTQFSSVQCFNTTSSDYTDYNALSIVYKFHLKGMNFVASGDITASRMSAIKDKMGRSDIFTMPHKGNDSNGSHPVDFINTTRPKFCVCQNSTAINVPRYASRGSKVFSSQENGHIVFEISDTINYNLQPIEFKYYWYSEDGQDFYFDNAGICVKDGYVRSKYNELFHFTNYVLDKNKWVTFGSNDFYYATASGKLAENQLLSINGSTYYFHPGGLMARNTKVWVNGSIYNCADNGVAVAVVV